ncbi:hypothetical protein R1flu_013966 [Riccia fluitans]|uniref:Uncharacterized protein n=1 Tax=Riccia fluitans TaxID=41844 RepID=A0ABD1YF37_9MARC
MRGQRYRARTSLRTPTFWGGVGPYGRPALEWKGDCNPFGWAPRVYKILIGGPPGPVDAVGTPCRFSVNVLRTVGRSDVGRARYDACHSGHLSRIGALAP